MYGQHLWALNELRHQGVKDSSQAMKELDSLVVHKLVGGKEKYKGKKCLKDSGPKGDRKKDGKKDKLQPDRQSSKSDKK